MVKSSNLEELFKKRKKFSPGTLATANTPDITYAEFKKLENETMKEIETMKLYNANVNLLKQKNGTYEQVRERLKERVKRLLNKTKLPSLLNPMKRERELVVDGFTPPKEGFTPRKGGYNSQKNRNTNITKQPRKPKILIKQPRKPKILIKQPRKPNNNK
jgi:FtsZ-binding cell division protein ZapB